MKRLLLAFSIAIAVLSSLFASLKSAALMRFRPHASFRPYDYGIRPRHVATLMSVVLLIGCSGAKTAGVWNKDLSEESPYVFTYDGSSDEAVATLKRTLLPKGFSVVNEDEYGEEGGTYIFEKTLADDEKIESTAFYTYMTGASTGTQTGRLVFTISRSGGATSVQMTPRLVATTQQYRENDSSTEKEEFPVKQGNPLPMKYGRLFAEMEKWQLEDPSRAAVFMNENTE
jgi:hypothetical protein